MVPQLSAEKLHDTSLCHKKYPDKSYHWLPDYQQILFSISNNKDKNKVVNDYVNANMHRPMNVFWILMDMILLKVWHYELDNSLHNLFFNYKYYKLEFHIY